MSGAARIATRLTFQTQSQLYNPDRRPDVSLAITDGATGVLRVDDAVTDLVLTFPGITTIKGLELVSDQPISVKIGTLNANVAFPLAAGFPLCMLGVTITALALSNVSGATASVAYTVVGD